MKQKYCPHCKSWKSVSEFYINKRNKDNLSSYCKKCACQININYSHSIIGRLSKIKGSAKTRNFKWEIPDNIGYILISLPCVYCGKIQEDFNGLDRIDSSKGYTLDNVVPCCKYCNRAKSDMTIKEFKKHIKEINKYMELDKDE